MRRTLLLIPLFVITLSATQALAQTVVTETWVPDPLYGGGGYYNIEVTNHTGSDLALVMVGNSTATVILTDPSLVGLWYPGIYQQSEWENGIGFQLAGYPIPDTTMMPWDDYFAGYPQVLIYYVRTGTPIADGATMGGFRFLATGSASPYALFDTDGNVVAQGETTDGALPTEHATWGVIKALLR